MVFHVPVAVAAAAAVRAKVVCRCWGGKVTSKTWWRQNGVGGVAQAAAAVTSPNTYARADRRRTKGHHQLAVQYIVL